MDISFLSSLAGLITFFISLLYGLWKAIIKLRYQIKTARTDSDEYKKYAEDLLSSATSAEKRADIYLYVTIRAIEIESRRTRDIVHGSVMGLAMLVLLTSFVAMSKFLEIDYKQPTMFIMYVGFLATLVSWAFALWFSWVLRRLELGWEVGVVTAMRSKLKKHDAKS